MGVMENIQLYHQLKGGKKEFLDSLEEKIMNLKEYEPSYYSIGKDIVDKLEYKLDISDDGVFRVGDKIIINDKADYNITKEGSEGVIKREYTDGDYRVIFTKLTGETSDNSKIHIINKRFMDKIGSNPFRYILDALKEDREFKEGDKVILGNINEDDGWHPDYQKERNENYPEGTKGIIKEYEDNNKFWVKFSKKGEWSREWNNIITEGCKIALYKKDELILLQTPKEDYSIFIDKLSKHTEESLITEIRAEIEPKYGFEKYEKKKEELIKKNIPLMKAYGLFESEIKEYFENKLPTSNLEEQIN